MCRMVHSIPAGPARRWYAGWFRYNLTMEYIGLQDESSSLLRPLIFAFPLPYIVSFHRSRKPTAMVKNTVDLVKGYSRDST